MTELLIGWFRILLWLVPGDLRDDHGDAMVADLRDSLAETRDGGWLPTIRAWSKAVGDLGRRAAYEHWLRRERANRKERRMASLPHDVRYAIRGLVRQPAATGLLVLTLTLAMASAMAVFGLIDGLILRPLPFDHAERLVYFNETAPRWDLKYTGVNYSDFIKWRTESRAFESMGLYQGSSVDLSDETGAERVLGANVTYDLATVLGIRPLLGRNFTAEDDRPGAPNVVMIGENLWRTRFGSVPNVIGQTLRLSGEPYSIVGVLPKAAAFPGEYVLWRTLREKPVAESQSYSYEGIGRLKPGVSMAGAREDLLQAHRSIWAESDTAHVVSPVALPLREFLSADFQTMTSALAVGVFLVLLCACANVASSMLARAIFRQREIALRVALGADPARVGRQMMVESLVLAFGAGVLGMLVGFWALGVFARMLPDQLPGWIDLSPRWSSAAAAMAIVAITAVIFGLAPSLQARREDPKTALAGAGGRASLSVSQRRMLNGFVIAEVALAAVLLVSSGLLFRAYQRVRAVDPGFQVDNVMSFQLSLPSVRYPDSAAIQAFQNRLTDQLTALAGVTSAGLINCPPLGCHQGNFFEIEGAKPRLPGAANPVTLTLVATPGVFKALGIRLIKGRLPEFRDGEFGTQKVVVVSEAFARVNWPGVDDPTGHRVRYNGGDSTDWHTVVGVLGDVRHYGLDQPPRPTLYFVAGPRNAKYFDAFAVVIRSRSTPAQLVEPVRRLVRELDPELPLYGVGTMEEQLQRSLAVWRVLATVLALFAAMALVLAVGGIYAVLSYLVGRRRIELGVRLALGAEPWQLVRLVVKQGLVLVGLGVLIGIPLAAGIAKLLSGKVVGLEIKDGVVWGVALVVIVATGVMAAAIPGRRAALVDPRTTLVGD